VRNGLIFDLDGTLVDSLRGIAQSLNRALTQLGLPTHPPEAVRGFIGNGSRVLARRAAPAAADEVVVGQIESLFKADYDVTWPDGTRAYEGIAGLLGALQSQGFPLAVLSNKPHPFTTVIVEKIFPEIRFEVVLGQLPGIPHKPDPSGALEIANLLGRLPEECVLIGDSTMDLETAANAGMRAIAVTWGFHDRGRLEAAGAKSFADAPQELLDMV
jgi:phosphoglycolate phosphatase